MGSMVGPMLTIILSTKLGLNAKEIAILSTIFMVFSIPTSLIGGKIADKFNKKFILNIGDIASSLIYIGCGIIGLNNYTLFLYYIGSLIQAAEGPAYESLLADFTNSEDRDRASSLMYWGLNLGLMLSPTLGGLLVNNYLNLLFIINGIVQLISIIIFDIFVKDISPTVDNCNSYENKVDTTSTIKLLKENKILTLFMLVLALGSTFYNMWGYIMPLTLNKVIGDNSSIIYGTMNSLNCFVVVLCTAPITSLFSKYKTLDRITIANVLELLGFVLFISFIKNIFMYYIAILIFTLGEILGTISTNPHLTKRIPINYRGRMLATSNFMFYFFNAIGQFIIGTIFDSKGMYSAWLAIICLGLFIMISYSLLKNPDKKTYPDLYKEK